jgi:hypothetical protein
MDLAITWLHVHRFFFYIGLVATLIFACWRTAFWLMHRHSKYFFFDPQDCFANKPQGRVLPKSAEMTSIRARGGEASELCQNRVSRAAESPKGQNRGVTPLVK